MKRFFLPALISGGILFCLALVFNSCDDDPETVAQPITPTFGQIRNGSKTILEGEQYIFRYSVNPDEVKKATLLIDGEMVDEHAPIEGSGEFEYSWNSSGQKMGNHVIELNMLTKTDVSKKIQITKTVVPRSAPKMSRIKLVKKYPHDNKAYTQGLEFDGSRLLEGTGLNNESTLRLVNLNSGQVLKKIDLDGQYFGEGITVWKDRIFQITWRKRKGFVYDKETFELVSEFSFNTPTGQGWGLAHSEEHLILSDGSHQLYFLNPNTLALERSIEVYSNNGKIGYLNELEYIDGRIYANVYETPFFVIIDPKTGKVLEQVDMSVLTQELAMSDEVNVLNGIAYQHETKKLYVTGKNWPYLFEVEIVDN